VMRALRVGDQGSCDESSKGRGPGVM